VSDSGRLPAALERARALTIPEVQAALERLCPDLRWIAAYHLGWVDEAGRPVAGRGGKWLRSGLALLSAEAAGAAARDGLPAAVAVELVHNFSLLHDDIMDGDTERRHRPTAWAVFGAGPAILAGDGLLALAQETLLDCPPPHGQQAAGQLAHATSRLIAGQAADLAFERRRAVSLADCRAMAADKTGGLLACAASLGAVLAGAPQRTVAALATYGLRLGLAFQAVDDLLGIWGAPEVTGKPAGSDLRQRKKTMPVVMALTASGPGAGQLAELLDAAADGGEDGGDGAGDAERVQLAVKLIEDSGARERTAAEADRQAELALASLKEVRMPAETREDLAAVARFVTEREL
jgi:geranylgeranyl diphosphate synthase, type I